LFSHTLTKEDANTKRSRSTPYARPGGCADRDGDRGDRAEVEASRLANTHARRGGLACLYTCFCGGFRRLTVQIAQVAAHNTAKSCYIRLLDYVFDVTAFLTRHPGGEKILLQQAGDKDRSNIFAGVHSNKAAKMLPDLLVGTISGAGSRWTASPVHPRAPAPVHEPSGSLKALARQDSQGSVFSDSCSNLESLEAFEIDMKNSQGKSLGADAEASGELQDDSQSTQEGAAHCEEVQLSFGQETSPENAQHWEVSLAGQDQRPKIAEPGHGTGAGQGEIHSAAASKYPIILPLEPEATAAIIGPTCSSATRTMQAPAGGTLDAKTGSPKAGHTLVGAESKCPFAAILKAAGHDIAGMSMPANHKSAHNDLPTGSPLAASSGAAGLFTMPRNRSSRGLSGMLELQAVPETRPMVVDSDVEDGMEDELSGATRVRQGSSVESKEWQGRVGGSNSRMNAAGWSRAAGSSNGTLSGSEKQVFKLSIHEAHVEASQSSHNSRASASSKGTASKQSSRGRATARKRRQRIARAKGNKVDMDEWNRQVGTIKNFWENLFKGVSMTGLGTSLLDTIETDNTLEPLFRCMFAQCASVCPCFWSLLSA
jgi:cytochrome b involved in lipid metabolism